MWRRRLQPTFITVKRSSFILIRHSASSTFSHFCSDFFPVVFFFSDFFQLSHCGISQPHFLSLLTFLTTVTVWLQKVKTCCRQLKFYNWFFYFFYFLLPNTDVFILFETVCYGDDDDFFIIFYFLNNPFFVALIFITSIWMRHRDALQFAVNETEMWPFSYLNPRGNWREFCCRLFPYNEPWNTLYHVQWKLVPFFFFSLPPLWSHSMALKCVSVSLCRRIGAEDSEPFGCRM